MTEMTPYEALSRIAYLLERTRAETYKVRAFRNAAAAIAGRSVEELSAMTARQLVAIPHVGERSAQVIAQVLGGEKVAYLEKLEEMAGEEIDEERFSAEAQELLGQLQGDCHSHSNWSDGGSPIEEMAQAAKDLGHHYWALTDHSPRLTVAHGLDRERLLNQLEILEELNEKFAPFRILTGIEVDILEDGSLDQDEDLLEGLDVVVASVHSKLRMEKDQMTARMLRALESPHVDILGHCTGRILVGRGRPESTFDAEAVFGKCAERGVAVEINSRPERLDPPERLLELALSLDCVLVIDSDAHAPGQLEWQRHGCEQAAKVKVPSEKIMNTRPLEEFLSWTKGHSS